MMVQYPQWDPPKQPYRDHWLFSLVAYVTAFWLFTALAIKTLGTLLKLWAGTL